MGNLRPLCLSLFLKSTLGLFLLPSQILAAVSKSEQTEVCLSSNPGSPSAPYFTVEAMIRREQSKGSDETEAGL